MHEVGHAEGDDVGGDVDDATAAGGAHRLGDGARAEEDGADVDAEHVFPLGQVDLPERPPLDAGEETRVVDEHVDAPVAVEHLAKRGRDRLLIGDVRCERERRAAGRLDRPHGLVGRGEVDRDDGRSAAGERLGDCAADRAGSTGDDRDLPGELGRVYHRVALPSKLRCLVSVNS